MNCGTATSAGPTPDSVIAGIIRKTQSGCMSPSEGVDHGLDARSGLAVFAQQPGN